MTVPRYRATARAGRSPLPGGVVPGATWCHGDLGVPPGGPLAERIVGPLGLERTTITPPDLDDPELRGDGTSVDDGSLVDVTDDQLASGNGGDGGIVSTASDLLTVIRTIVSGGILRGELLDDTSTPSAAAARTVSTYGLGIGRYRRRVVGSRPDSRAGSSPVTRAASTHGVDRDVDRDVVRGTRTAASWWR